MMTNEFMQKQHPLSPLQYMFFVHRLNSEPRCPCRVCQCLVVVCIANFRTPPASSDGGLFLYAEESKRKREGEEEGGGKEGDAPNKTAKREATAYDIVFGSYANQGLKKMLEDVPVEVTFTSSPSFFLHSS